METRLFSVRRNEEFIWSGVAHKGAGVMYLHRFHLSGSSQEALEMIHIIYPVLLDGTDCIYCFI